jgi:hypothetical protein
VNKSPQPLLQQATLLDGEKPTWSEAWRRECEARDWLRRFKIYQRKHGTRLANAWWAQTIEKIEKIRGPGAAHTLRQDMNKVKNEGGKN